MKHPEDFERVGLSQFAREINRTPHQTKKLLRKLGFIGLQRNVRDSRRAEITYSTQALETVKEMLGIPSRAIPGEGNWLDDYLEGEAHVRLRRDAGPDPTGPA